MLYFSWNTRLQEKKREQAYRVVSKNHKIRDTERGVTETTVWGMRIANDRWR